MGDALTTLSWRRFQVLLRGLSPNSATVTKLVSTRSFGKRRDKVNEVRGAKAAQSAFDAIFKPPASVT